MMKTETESVTETGPESETAVGYIRLFQDGKSLPRQRRDIEDYASERDAELLTVYDEGKRSSGFDTDRPEYTALREHVADGGVDTVIVPNLSRLSRLSRDRKERLRLLLDVDTAGVAVHSVELGRAVDLDDDWALVHQSIRATTDDVEKRKEIARSKRATKERIENGYDHGRPPFGLTYEDSDHYWVPDRDTDEYQVALTCIRLRENNYSWREIERETSVNKALPGASTPAVSAITPRMSTLIVLPKPSGDSRFEYKLHFDSGVSSLYDNPDIGGRS